ncbi:uncharacterized protein [Amphiura filiformis]|uniref:uncharacterized protein n=1 Tax=Amphiura filiformis TaxID=82378 RepID=UPI003B22294C
MNFRIIILQVLCVLNWELSSVNSQSGTELLSCDFEMPTDCGFVVRTAGGGIQWSLNNGKSFEGKVYGPPKDHTTGTADGYYASTVVIDSSQFVVAYPVQTDMMTPKITLPNGEGALVFYFYVWRSAPNDLEGTTLNVYGCKGRKLWGSTVHAAMEGWQRLEIPLHCPEAFEIYFEGIHQTVGSSISMDDVKVFSTPLDTGNHSPFPPYPGTGAPDASIPASMATKASGEPTWPITEVVTPTKLTTGHRSSGGGVGSGLAVVLFLLAFLLLGMSVAVHMFIWRKRWFRNERRQPESKGVQVHNSAYDCLTVHPGSLGGIRGSPEGNSLRSSARSGKGESSKNSHSTFDIEANHGAATMDQRRSSFRSGFLHRSRSKTLPSKGSQSSFGYYEIVEFDDTTGKNVIRRAPKLSVIGKSRAISRSNSVPLRKQSSSGTYEMVECNFIGPGGPGGLYHITNLVNSPLRRDPFAIDSSMSSLDSKSLSTRENTPFDTLSNRQRLEIPQTSQTKYAKPTSSFTSPSDIYSTITSKISQKLRKDPHPECNAYDTPQARRKAYRKQSQELRKQSTGHSSFASPNYYTLEPNLLIPDVVTSTAASKLRSFSESSTVSKLRSFSESSTASKLRSLSEVSSRKSLTLSERLECLDSANCSYNTLSEDFTDVEDN